MWQQPKFRVVAASFKTPKCPKRYSQRFKELLGYYNSKRGLSTMLALQDDFLTIDWLKEYPYITSTLRDVRSLLTV